MDNILGKEVKLYRDVVIKNSVVGDKSIVADDCYVTNSNIGSYVRLERRSMIFNSYIGNCSSIGFNSIVRNCEIGNYTDIAWNATIGGAQHPKDRISMGLFAFNSYYDFINIDEETNLLDENNVEFYKGAVVLKNDVWCGAASQIMRGVIIDNGAIIGAGSIVTHNVGPYEIWTGVPARKIGQRFSDEIIAELLELEWWIWPRNIIRDNIHKFRKKVDLDLLKDLKAQSLVFK